MKVIILMTLMWTYVGIADIEVVRVPSMQVCEQYKERHQSNHLDIKCDRFGGTVSK